MKFRERNAFHCLDDSGKAGSAPQMQKPGLMPSFCESGLPV